MIADTLRFSKLLYQKGHFTVEQADVLAETTGSVTTEGLATKTGLAPYRRFALCADPLVRKMNRGP